MRWKKPFKGQRRERKFFAWLPVSSREEPNSFRWLETVEVLEEYWEGLGGGSVPRNARYWKIIRFLDRE